VIIRLRIDLDKNALLALGSRFSGLGYKTKPATREEARQHMLSVIEASFQDLQSDWTMRCEEDEEAKQHE